MTDLRTVAEAAGLKDPDLLKIANQGMTAADAVADLRNRYPGAFAAPKMYRDMTPAEQAAWKRRAGVAR